MKTGIPPVIRAEQALLGAILTDPSGQAWLLDLVDPADLTRPYHAQVLAAMNRAWGRGVPPGPLAVREEIQKDPDLPRLISHDGVLVINLMEAGPRPAHAPAYAAMVISTGVRRRMTLAASRMRQAARGGDLKITLRTAETAKRELERCRLRWEALPEPMRRALPAPAPGHHGPQEIAGQLAAVRGEIRTLRQDLRAGAHQELAGRFALIADRVAGIAAVRASMEQRQIRGAAGTRPTGPNAEAAGAQVLRDLIASPSHITAVQGWLRPPHFARADHSELYALMHDMAAVGKPIDPVTVAWEAAQRGIQADAADLADGNGPFAVASAREVHRHGVLAQIAHAGREIQGAATNAASSVEVFLNDTVEQLDRLEDAHSIRERYPGVRAEQANARRIQHQQDREQVREAAS